jgi:hypothetical protein
VSRFQLDPLQPASPQSPFLGVEGPCRPDGSGLRRLSASLLLSYARSPLTVHAQSAGAERKLGEPVSSSTLLMPGLAAQLTRTLSLDLLVPVALHQAGSDVAAGQTVVRAPASRTSLGDVRVGALYRAWLQPWYGVVAGLRVRTPTGSRDSYMGDDRVHPGLLAGAFASIDPVQLACTAWFDPLFASYKRGDRLAAGCAADVRFTTAGSRVGVEFLAAALRHRDDASAASLLEAWATLRQPLGPVQAGLAAGAATGNAPGVAAARVLATLSYAPQLRRPAAPRAAPDQDLDRIPDAEDACPAEAGPRSSEKSRNGCPDLDIDGDGVPDHLDACPENAGARSSDPAVAGCPDMDNDGVPDRVDSCPGEPAPRTSNPAAPGCPGRARLVGERFAISPPLTPEGAPDDAQALAEIAFALRVSSAIRKVAVEVSLQGNDSDEQLADRAVELASALVERLVELGVERRRLEPVGGVSSAAPAVTITVTDRVPARR